MFNLFCFHPRILMSSKCDLQGSQGKPIALGANSNARTHQPSVQIQDRLRIESPTMFIGAVAICDNQEWFELKGNNKENLLYDLLYYLLTSLAKSLNELIQLKKTQTNNRAN